MLHGAAEDTYYETDDQTVNKRGGRGESDGIPIRRAWVRFPGGSG